MPCARFEPTISASERAKTVHALDRSASETGKVLIKSDFKYVSDRRVNMADFKEGTTVLATR
jgi:hypothetical protein